VRIPVSIMNGLDWMISPLSLFYCGQIVSEPQSLLVGHHLE